MDGTVRGIAQFQGVTVEEEPWELVSLEK